MTVVGFLHAISKGGVYASSRSGSRPLFLVRRAPTIADEDVAAWEVVLRTNDQRIRSADVRPGFAAEAGPSAREAPRRVAR